MIKHVGVVIPAHNERLYVGECLSSLMVAAQVAAESGIAVDVVVVLDRCTDGTREVVTTFAGVRTVTVDAGQVGAARAAGAALVLAQTPSDPTAVWLANTDADSVVPATWLTGMIAEADAGHHVVLGTVVPGPGLHVRVAREWRRAHPGGRGHRHVHGANLGIRADAYRLLGGWRAIATGEDVQLAAAAEAEGLAISRIDSIPVATSSRLTGRAPAGFASYLQRMSVELGVGQAGAGAGAPRAIRSAPSS